MLTFEILKIIGVQNINLPQRGFYQGIGIGFLVFAQQFFSQRAGIDSNAQWNIFYLLQIQ